MRKNTEHTEDRETTDVAQAFRSANAALKRRATPWRETYA
jgi:hypothetical protein